MTVDHWKDELLAAMLNLTDRKLKASSIYDSLYKEWIKKEEYHKSPGWIMSTVLIKLRRENISDRKWIYEKCKELADELPKLIKVIGTGDINLVDDYIEKL